MKNGLYKATFSYGGDGGNGVMKLTDGEMRGGDSSFAYVGTLNHEGGGAVGVLNVSRHSPGLPSVLGVDNYQLTVTAKATDTDLKGTAETPSLSGVTLAVELALIVED
jgi:hypothetical protein